MIARRRATLVLACRWGLALSVLLVLELGARLGWLDVLTWVPLSQILSSLIEGVSSGEFVAHWTRSLTGILLAFLLAVGVGVPLGYVMWRMPPIYRSVELYLESYYALPFFVFYPVVILFIGLNVWSIVAIVFLWAVGGVIVNTTLGFIRVPQAVLKYAKSLGLSSRQTFEKIQFPSAAPSILTGLKLAVTYSVAGTIGVEFILSSGGVGYAIKNSYDDFRVADMYALIASVLTLALLAHWVIRRMEDSVNERRGYAVDHTLAAEHAMGPKRTRRPGARKVFHVGTAIVPVVLTLVWYLASWVADSSTLPYPHVVLGTLINGITSGSITDATMVTLKNTLVALAISAGFSIPFGYLLGASRFLREVFEGWIMALYTTPKIVLYPIFLLVFGFTDAARIGLGVIHGVPIILIFTIAAVRAVNPGHIKVARSLQMNSVSLFRHIILPSSLPEVVAGLRFGLSLCFLGVLIAEMLVAVSRGAGHEILRAAEVLNVDYMFAVVLLVMVLAIVMNALMSMLERAVRP